MSKLAPSQSRSFAITFGIQSTQVEVAEVARSIQALQGDRRTRVLQRPEADPSITVTKPITLRPEALFGCSHIVDALRPGRSPEIPQQCVLNLGGRRLMQSVAAEMNLSETAFLVPRQDGFDLRWFTPSPKWICGRHARRAHILWETERLLMNEPARLYTRSGAYRHACRRLD